MNPTRATKVVQTEVDLATYTRLRHIANRRGEPLKRLVRTALRKYVSVEDGNLEDDSMFEFIGSMPVKGTGWARRKDWRK